MLHTSHLLLFGGERVDIAKLIKPKQLQIIKCCTIKFENVVFSSINCSGSEFHSRMVLGK